jgi:diguanylate cyclase (GGDEF)-like protein
MLEIPASRELRDYRYDRASECALAFLQLDRELARCKRDNTNLTVMVSDMDGFKQINDRFGHLEGNRVLRLFAHSLKETSREYDYVARMGGDEFVVIAPGLTPEASARKAEQMRELVHQVGIEVCGEDILSLSVGKSVYPEDGLDAEKLLTEADRRMYTHKQSQPTRKNRRMYPRAKGMTTEPTNRGKSGQWSRPHELEPGWVLRRNQRDPAPKSQVRLTFSVEHTAISLNRSCTHGYGN